MIASTVEMNRHLQAVDHGEPKLLPEITAWKLSRVGRKRKTGSWENAWLLVLNAVVIIHKIGPTNTAVAIKAMRNLSPIVQSLPRRLWGACDRSVVGVSAVIVLMESRTGSWIVILRIKALTTMRTMISINHENAAA